MGIKRHSPEEIVTKLRQVEVLVGQGMARIDAIRQIMAGSSVATKVTLDLSCGLTDI